MIGRPKFVAIICACTLLLPAGAWAQTASRLQVDASIDHTNKEPAVTFRVSNISNEAIVINESALPWGNRYGVLLFAVTKRGQQTLKAGYPVSDVFFEKPIRLDSKATLSGVVTLSSHFGDISATVGKDDLIVFWFFEPKDARQEALGQYGGWLVFPKAQEK